MNEVGVMWRVAGGWAIDLWLGEQTREHHDIEVIVPRHDQQAVHQALHVGWELYCLDPPGSGWRPWRGQLIEPRAFQLQVRSAGEAFDIFTETIDNKMWHFRRDERIVRSAADLVLVSASGIPIVRPEVQLLYMAKSDEAKNQHDFAVARPTLDSAAVSWLAHALATTIPTHPWLADL